MNNTLKRKKDILAVVKTSWWDSIAQFHDLWMFVDSLLWFDDKPQKGSSQCENEKPTWNNEKPWKPTWNHEKPTWNHENHENRPGTMVNQPETMKKHENRPGTMKNHGNRPGTMKNQPGTMKNHDTDLVPWKTNLEGINKNVTNRQTDRTFLWKTNLEPWKPMKPTWNHKKPTWDHKKTIKIDLKP